MISPKRGSVPVGLSLSALTIKAVPASSAVMPRARGAGIALKKSDGKYFGRPVVGTASQLISRRPSGCDRERRRCRRPAGAVLVHGGIDIAGGLDDLRRAAAAHRRGVAVPPGSRTLHANSMSPTAPMAAGRRAGTGVANLNLHFGGLHILTALKSGNSTSISLRNRAGNARGQRAFAPYFRQRTMEGTGTSVTFVLAS